MNPAKELGVCRSLVPASRPALPGAETLLYERSTTDWLKTKHCLNIHDVQRFTSSQRSTQHLTAKRYNIINKRPKKLCLGHPYIIFCTPRSRIFHQRVRNLHEMPAKYVRKPAKVAYISIRNSLNVIYSESYRKFENIHHHLQGGNIIKFTETCACNNNVSNLTHGIFDIRRTLHPIARPHDTDYREQ